MASNAVFKTGPIKTFRYRVEELAAGVDIAERAIGSWAGVGHIVGARIVNEDDASAGIDGSNTCVITLQRGATAAAAVTFATVTYNATLVFPLANVIGDDFTLTPSNFPIAAADILTLVVTNGANADPGRFTVEVDYVGG